MRLHLVIQRHGLPVVRILWTTSPPSLSPGSSVVPAASSSLTSTRAPNALFSNGGYTIAQFLEDVNEVVPLETEPTLFDNESSGQWGLEDYVVEVGGSECLHFMELEGLLRDGDEVVIRALQIADLRVRRLSGRHQISGDGKHLIDGVPFGRPFLKRQSSSRPAISIPPRKKRRTLLAGWDNNAVYGEEEVQWDFPGRVSSLKRLSVKKENQGITHGDEQLDYYEDDYEDYHENQEEPGDGTVIRYPVNETEDVEASESDADESAFEADMAEELEELAKDREIAGLPTMKSADDQKTGPKEYPLRSRHSILKTTPRKASGPQSVKKSPSGLGSSRRDSKVRFENLNEEESPLPLQAEKSQLSKVELESEDSASYKSCSSGSVSSSSVSTSDDEDSASVSEDSASDSEKSTPESESESESESEAESEDEDEDSDSTSESEDSATSESEDESIQGEAKPLITNPPGYGSIRTKKSNQRSKMRRRLAKLKELGALPSGADFTALREWEDKNGTWYEIPDAETGEKRLTKEQEQVEFEAKRQKLLRDLESGGVDIDAVFEKENVPPHQAEKTEQQQAKDNEIVMDTLEKTDSPPAKRRTLDVASTRRLLFGSLGVRTPRTKEDEETTRKKLAGKVKNVHPQKTDEQAPVTEEIEKDSEVNWQDKLILKATECVFDDVELTAPPYPFEQRWDAEAQDIIRKRKGLGKKRKRRQQLQVYDGEGEGYENGYDGYEGYDGYAGYDGYDGYENGDGELNYDDSEQQNNEFTNEIEQTAEEVSPKSAGDLPLLPDDISSVPDLDEDDLKCGSIVAFKQLDLSKATNWQPTISEYRVAEIHEVFDDSIIQLRLAKRDRRQVEDAGDEEEEGPRQYSGFEMPGLDEDEDDGFREVSFSDLIDAKLLRAAAAAADLGDANKASISLATVEATTENKNTRDIPMTDDDHQHLTQDSKDSPALQDVERPANMTADASELPAAKAGENSIEESASPDIRSPQFLGFHSPSARMESSSKSSPKRHVLGSLADQTDGNDDDCEAFGTGPPGEDMPTTPRSTASLNIFGDDPDDDMQLLSSPDNLISFDRLLEQLFQGKGLTGSPVPKKERKEQKDSAEKQPTQSQSSTSSVVPNPFYEIDKAHEEHRLRKSKSMSNVINNEDTTMDPELPSPLPADKSPTSAQPKRSPTPQEATFLTAVEESNLGDREEEEDFDNELPKASQMSQVIVDLTQSSPPVSPGGSDKDFAKSHRLPRESGWVQKDISRSRRSTRLSSSRQQVQILNEVSISPPKSRKGKGRKN